MRQYDEIDDMKKYTKGSISTKCRDLNKFCGSWNSCSSRKQRESLKMAISSGMLACWKTQQYNEIDYMP